MNDNGKNPRLLVKAMTIGFIALMSAEAAPSRADSARTAEACAGDNGGITLPRGFCATIFADKIGHARHLVVAPNGVVYVNTWSGVYFGNDTPPDGGFLVALQDPKGDGHADATQRFGETVASGGHGGTGIAIYQGALYAEIDDRIVRYALAAGELAPAGRPETILSGLPLTGDHPMHPFAIDAKGEMFVDLGTATNSCEEKNRMAQSPGIEPCPELATRGGIWRYDAGKTGQRFSPAERFATGLRNGEGIAFDAAGRIFATQHGRDQLAQSWPKLYSPLRGQTLPAEELVELSEGADFGWPHCYFDDEQKKLVLAPEYGGDGGSKIGVCAQKQAPVAFFPAHWAPDDMQIYNATQFPAAYRGGAFIAFHGSWNRAPAPQGGYNVVFQPIADGKASGHFVVFADGFAGASKEPGKAAHRPAGIAVGPDGALYVADDKAGRIWRITFNGAADVTEIEDAPSPAAMSAAGADDAMPPEGIHPDAGKETQNLPTPPGATKRQVAIGGRIFRGELGGGTCAGCHGSDAGGGPIGPDLTAGTWLWSDGSLPAIIRTIAKGVPSPKQHPGAMPPMGGAPLSQAKLKAVAAYVWAVGHQNLK